MKFMKPLMFSVSDREILATLFWSRDKKIQETVGECNWFPVTKAAQRKTKSLVV